MGGRAFGHLEVSRIHKPDIVPTLYEFSKHTGIKLTVLTDNLMGSCGKQTTSGDIDIVLDEQTYASHQMSSIAGKLILLLGDEYVKYRPNNDMLQVAFPQYTVLYPPSGTRTWRNETHLVQIDLIRGNPEWIKFSHWAPGPELGSPWKGVFISQTFGVLAKMNIMYRYPENAIVNKAMRIDMREAEMNLSFSLERGLTVMCRMRNKKDGTFARVSPDYFESNCEGGMPPHVPRYGYIKDPEACVKMLVGRDVAVSDCDTFENLLQQVRNNKTDAEWDAFTQFLATSLRLSGAKYFYEDEDLVELLLSY